MKIFSTLLILLACLSGTHAGDLTLKQQVADIPLSHVSLRLTAQAGGEYDIQGKRQNHDDLVRLLNERPGAIEYIYVSGEDLTVQHLLELARLGKTHGFRTLYHQNEVLKIITVE